MRTFPEATTLNNMGAAYSHLGDAQRALELYREAVPAFQATGDKKGIETASKNIEQLNRDHRSRSSDRN